MKKRIKIKLVTCIAVAVGIVSAGTAVLANHYLKASANSIFLESDNVKVTKNFMLDSALGIEEQRSGLLLSATESASKISFAQEMSGAFEMDFRVFSEDIFPGGDNISGDTIINPVLALKEMTFTFTDLESGNAFDIIIDGESKTNFATPQVSVNVEDKRVGLYWVGKTAKHPATGITDYYVSADNTTQANANDRYTMLYGNSFSNKAYSDEKTVAESVESTVISFNPFTMEVYASVNGEQTLVWDMSKSELYGQTAQTIEPFGSYSVQLSFSEIAENKQANFVLYSLNGQDLSGGSFTNQIGPNVGAKYTTNAIKNEKFFISKPVLYDVLGDEAKEISITASIGDKAISVYDKNGKKTDIYSDGCYLIPNAIGDLAIRYVAKDAEFAGNPFVAKLKCYTVEPNIEYSIDGVIKNGEYGVGTKITLPTATAKSEYFRYTPNVSASVYKNGELLSGYEMLTQQKEIVFDEEAEYKIVYSCENARTSLIYRLNITDSLPAFNYDKDLLLNAKVGETVELPTMIASFGGQTKDSKPQIYDPNGVLTQTQNFTYVQAGVYKILYTVEFEGVEYENTFEVNVLGQQESFSSSFGVATLGASCLRYDALKGVLLENTNNKDVFTYTRVIDLSNYTIDDTLLTMYGSATWGNKSGTVYIMLTDVYNPENVVTIWMRYGYDTHQYRQLCYTYAPNQTPKSVVGKVYREKDGWGRELYYSHDALISPLMPFLDQKLELRYDNASKTLYYGSNIIVDLDADYQEVPWTGFTTGEVYLSIRGISKALVTVVDNNDMSGGAFYTDSVAPEIYVNTEGYAEDALPQAVVDEPYKVFDAMAKDNWTNDVVIDVRVYYAYGTVGQTELNIKDGAFLPKKWGVYTIVYTAKDAYNNIVVKTLSVNTTYSEDVQEVEFELSAEPENIATLGLSYAIPQIVTKAGGIGELSETILLLDPNGNELEVSGESFVPQNAGIYTLQYRVSDYIGAGKGLAVKTFYITANASVAPILHDVLLPDAILSGAEIIFPECEGIDYTSGSPKKADVSISAMLDGVALTVTDRRCVPVVEGTEGLMTVTYASGAASKSYRIHVVNPGKGSGFMGNYFYPVEGAIEKESTRNGITLTSTTDSVVQFINPILADNVYLKFNFIDLTKNNTNAITVWLYDSLDLNISARIDFLKKEGDENNCYVSINGGANRTVSGSSFLSTSAGLGFSYKDVSKALISLSGNVIGYLSDDNANFAGFPSGKVIMKIGISNVSEGGAQIQMTQINNQTLSELAQDVIVPEFKCSEAIPLNLEGSELKIPALIAQDVLSAQIQISVSVQLVGGDVLYTSTENIEKVLSITQLGRYRISYTVKDASNRTARGTYMVSPVDNEAPTFKFTSNLVTNYKLGDELKLPEIESSDNSGKKPTVAIYIYAPNGAFFAVDRLLDGDGIAIGWKPVQLTQLGEYKVKYVVYDESFNTSEQIFMVTVE